ncbi:ABC transporter ATP-binding protein [uncultured Lactobacillus sp.]|uniref:ABC transporter ATP-binding protein n=1 Tax=uncultured Lactobacillus sp. TaxID=153152 RepID=UPI002806024B|nr:ABC transporter ATP-binding protein [uncultured Lactobacillus sp.]
MLIIKNLTFSFRKKCIFKNLNLEIPQGRIVGLVAPNGTGKSTLINLLLNNLKPQAGYVEYMGIRYKNERDVIRLHKKICAFPDQSDLFPFMTGKDHLKLYASLWNNDKRNVDKIISRLNMNNYINQKVELYSLGMKQRLCFAMVVAADTPVMLLDEVMNGLDPQNVQLISKELLRLKSENKLIIMASHLLANLQEYADEVIFLKDRKIAKIFDQDSETKKYLKMASDDFKRTAMGLDAKILANGLTIIDLANIDDEQLTTLLSNLVRDNISYSIEPLNLDDIFNLLYG